MGFLDDLFGTKPKTCDHPVVVEMKVSDFWGTKRVPKTMPCKKKPGHWGGHDPLVSQQ